MSRRRKPVPEPDDPDLMKILEATGLLPTRRQYKPRVLLPPAEYAFRSLPKSQQKAAYCWEICREWSSGQPPFMSLEPEMQKKVTLFVKKRLGWGDIVESAPIEELLGLVATNDLQSQVYRSTLHILRIDWSCNKKELIRAFSRWLDSSQSTALGDDVRKIEEKRGRKHDYCAWLKDLTIFRVSRFCNFERAGLHMDPPPSRVDKWNEAIDRAEQRILENRFLPQVLKGLQTP
jgi:hypothetical protein